MEAPSNPVDILEDEGQRIGLFQSFWDRRIDVESNYIRELEGLLFTVPGPAGSLKDALDELNKLLHTEIDQRTIILNMLQKLRGDSSSPFGGWGKTSRADWFTSKGDYFYKRISGLAKQKSELTPQEALVERQLSTDIVDVQSPIDAPKQLSIAQLFLGKPKNQPPPNTLKPTGNVGPSFTQFASYDRRYRNLLGHYNDSRERYIGESMQMANNLVLDESKAITMIQKMLNEFADSQINFATALSKGSSNCRSIADKISPTTEGHNCLTRIQDSISAAFGRPHLYKNFWFGVGFYQRSMTMLFGYIPNSSTNNTTLEFMTRLFKVLVKYDPCLALDGPDNPIDGRNQRLSKLAHDLETCWDPEQADGGDEVVRLLTTDKQYQGLALHFLSRTPRPLAHPPKWTTPTTISEMFQLFCEGCNKFRSYSERKMLSVVIHLLVDSSTDWTGVQWTWWDQYDRKKYWYWALTWQDQDHDTINLFPLLVHCIDPRPEEFVFHREKFEGLYITWKQSMARSGLSITPDLPPM